MLKKFSLLFASSQICVILISLLLYGRLQLLHYINITFLIGAAFLLFSITVYLLSTGFFDIVTTGFRKTFGVWSRMVSKEDIEDMRPLSEAVSMNFLPALLNGLAMMAAMFIALYFYYK